MTLQQIKDPAPNVQPILCGVVLGVGVSMAGRGAGDGIRMIIAGATGGIFGDSPLTFTTVHRHSYWSWHRQLPSTPGAWAVSILVDDMAVWSGVITAT